MGGAISLYCVCVTALRGMSSLTTLFKMDLGLIKASRFFKLLDSTVLGRRALVDMLPGFVRKVALVWFQI